MNSYESVQSHMSHTHGAIGKHMKPRKKNRPIEGTEMCRVTEGSIEA